MNACTATESLPGARGMIFIHSTPVALCPHLEWAIASVLGAGLNWQWTEQNAEPGSHRAELSWSGPTGSGARLASRLAEFARIRFEVTEEAILGAEGTRYCYTPSLGPFAATVGVHGDILVPEDRIRHALDTASVKGMSVHQAMERLLGTEWDEELEQFRYGSEDAPIRWLHQVV